MSDDLHDSANLLDACVSCGLCLSSCPTYVTEPLEQLSPRGRISAMRLHAQGDLPLTDPDYVESMETCVQCRACEDVCPSGVQFGALMESARAELAASSRRSAPGRMVEALAFRALASRAALGLLSIGLAVLQLLRLDRLLPARLRLPRHSFVPSARLRSAPLVGDQQPLVFRGCVMDQWFRPVHQAVIDLLGVTGRTADAKRRGRCCGALSLHAGRTAEAQRLAQEVVDAHRGSTGPIVVDSAGCGAAMKEYGRLLGTAEAAAFAARVKDPTEVLSAEALAPLALPGEKVGYLPSCHLRNVQGVVDQPLALLRSIDGLEVVVPADAPRCCGAGGAYSVMQPELSEAIGERLADAYRRAGVDRVVCGNPGCALQLEKLGFAVEHTASILDRARKSSS